MRLIEDSCHVYRQHIELALAQQLSIPDPEVLQLQVNMVGDDGLAADDVHDPGSNLILSWAILVALLLKFRFESCFD